MPSPHQQYRTAPRGFTLVELMAVVIIVGVLATVAVFSVRRYVRAAKTSEAYEMIQAIKAAQEAFRQETFSYCDVSGSLSNYYPSVEPRAGKALWNNPNDTSELARKWRMLGVNTTGYVQFRYATVAGGQNAPIPQPHTEQAIRWPNPSGPWYLVEAVADQDQDGQTSVFVASSFTAEVYAEHDTE